MTVKREHLWMVMALIVGFVIGVYYSKNTSASLVLAGMPQAKASSNGTAAIPVYGMVTAAQGVADNGST